MPSKVSLVRCEDYSPDKVYAAVKKSLELIGAIESFVKPGDRVLIKPNLLSARAPEKAITTHPEVLRAVIRLVKSAGGVPGVGDSHGGSHHRMEEVYEKTGTGRVCEEEKTQKLVFEKFKMVEGFPIALAALEADVLISLPKFKTHSLTVLTAGVKNVFGVVPGLYKTRCHMQAPGPEAFQELLARVYRCARPHLSVLDGITAMEGEGPGSAGVPRQMNLIASSPDAASLDSVLCRIMGIEPEAVGLIRQMRLKGLGETKNIEILGEKWEAFHKKDFRLPRTTFAHKLPGAALKPLTFLLKTYPEIDPSLCRNCGICLKDCPAEAISRKKGKLVFDRKKCVLCLCCLEFCPHRAVYIRKNKLLELLG